MMYGMVRPGQEIRGSSGKCGLNEYPCHLHGDGRYFASITTEGGAPPRPIHPGMTGICILTRGNMDSPPRTIRLLIVRAMNALLISALLAGLAVSSAWGDSHRYRVKRTEPGKGLLVPIPGKGPAEKPSQRFSMNNHYPDGALRTEWQVRTGEKGELIRHGPLVRYHPNGKPSLRAFYRDDQPVGLWQWFDEEGRLYRKAMQDGDFEQIVKGRELEDPLTVYRNQKGDVLAKGLLKYDKAHGPWQYYYPGGQLKAKGSFVRGIPDSRWHHEYPSGQISRIEEFRLGTPHGEYMEAYPNGQERIEGRFNQGLREGLWRTWFENGQLESSGVYREDLQEGEWRMWDQMGRMVGHVRYRHGQPVEQLPLPTPRGAARPKMIPDIRALPFRPRIYEDTGREIELKSP